MCMLLERFDLIDETELSCHAQVDDQDDVSGEMNKDVFATPAHRLDAHTRDCVDELFGFRVADDRRKSELASGDRAANEMRSEVGDDRLDLRKLRHG